ncbi:beta-galactosidase [Brevundimonas sp. SORGH_AS_0993]|uniref:beta-galactosidase n=1 Tax=Brevundimonas sp. SORGH_AS_0993 TaxID=3041794 RepID=UPI0027812064|nr:beta-galactosidase [Brevundimonas sp. SORGH_AS_0993]MDQ1155632.1 beta-galactosidase GanA [Brevundimonas sp. SORGH_AS_0993]
MRALLLAAAVAAAPLVQASAAVAQTAQATADFAAPAQTFGRVSYDARSLMIDGKRLVIWSSEMHPFRLPSPELWRDVLQKMKASGFNTVAFYFDWGYHSPKQGVYDFTGIRDLDLLLKMSEEEGLYVIVRPGPYANAELTRGGFPGWLVNQRAPSRTDSPEYLAAADEWMTHINAIIARHQINGDGRGNQGSVILYQIENELAVTTPAHRRYMDHLYAKARADGINVPIFHNDQGRNGYWAPENSPVDKVVHGPVDLYAFDGYPGGTCTVGGQTTRGAAAPDWGFYGPGGAKGGASASPSTPGFMAEIGGGWFDYWGSNGGYECNARQRGERFQRVFYGVNLANGISLQSIYVGFGGTSWGWLAAPVVFTSYDYGAAISEARDLRPKAEEMKQLAGLLESVPDLAGMIPAGPVEISSPNIQVYHNRSPETDARFLLVTHKPSNGQTNDDFTVTADLPDGRYVVPMTLNGFDAKWLVAGVDLAGQRLVYSTSEVQAVLPSARQPVVLMYGRKDEPGQTMLRFASAPTVTVLEGQVRSAFDPATGDLKLDYAHQGLARVKISGGGRPDLLLLIGEEKEAARFWRQGEVLVRGPALLRHARIERGQLLLTGDTNAETPLELWSSAPVRSVRWNGATVATRTTASGGLEARTALPGPADFALPVLTNWRAAPGSPEAKPDFDDRDWQAIDNRAYASNTLRPDGQPNMLMDAYGFHEGDVWYRGRFEGGPNAETIELFYGAGGAGMLQLFLDGELVGQDELPTGMPRPITTGMARFTLPAAARTPGPHVLSVMVRNNGHNWNLDANDFHKEARGLVSVSVGPRAGPGFSVPVAWKIQGRQGGEDFTDTVRGVANNGGLFGERNGWHLPQFDDTAWSAATVGQALQPGVTWYRTGFDLNVPQGQDASIGLAFGDIDKPRSDRAYRVLIFVNGWHMGQFIANVGPQRVFTLPEGILNARGHNTIALAVSTDGAPGNVLEDVRLITQRNVRGGVQTTTEGGRR